MNSSYDFGDPQNDHMARLAMSQQNAYGLSALGMMAHDKYAMCNSLSFRPGEKVFKVCHPVHLPDTLCENHDIDEMMEMEAV